MLLKSALENCQWELVREITRFLSSIGKIELYYRYYIKIDVNLISFKDNFLNFFYFF